MKLLSLFLFLVTGVFLSACSAPMTKPAAADQQKSDNRYSYLALGDSYTIGEGVPVQDQWGVQLAGLLRKEGVDVANPVTIARTGWTTAELSNAIAAAGITRKFDLVSLLIGVNNQYRGQSLDLYRKEFVTLLQTAITFADNKPTQVMVLSIPDWGATPFAAGRDRARIASEIDAFNAVAKEEAAKAGVAFVNITPLTRQVATNPNYLAPDGLHYSGAMHLAWAQETLPLVKQFLK